MLKNTYVFRYGIGNIPSVPPPLRSFNPHALVYFFESVDYHKYFGAVHLECDLWYHLKQAFLYGLIDTRVCIARSPPALPLGNLHGQEKGRVIASRYFLKLRNTSNSVSEFICDKSALSRRFRDAGRVHFTHQLSQRSSILSVPKHQGLLRRILYLFLI